jgi:[ribosomal protein S5]-alanine N-acetyltransferase
MPDVILAPATRADAVELIRGNLESREHHRPWATPFTDEAGFDAWFGRTLTGPHVGLVAREAASGRVVGVVNLMEIVANPFYQGAYLGYHGMATLAGRGLMTKAVRLATAHAFEALGLHRLEANIQPGNTRSIALVKRLGFRLEGFSPRYLRLDGAWRDHQRWALLADEAGCSVSTK